MMQTISFPRGPAHWMDRVLFPRLGRGTACVLIALRLGHTWLFWRAYHGDEIDQALWRESFALASLTLLGMTTAVGAIYGFHRARGRNPLTIVAYRDWLARTPWESPEPLPWGPVLPAIQDLFALLFLTAIVAGVVPPILCLAPSAAAVVAYVMALFFVVLNWRPTLRLYPVLWLLMLGFACRDWPAVWYPLLYAALAIISCLTHLTLRDFRRLTGGHLSRDPDLPPAVNLEKPIGAPWSFLAPHRFGTMVSWTQALALASTVGLLVWSFQFNVDPREDRDPRFLLLLPLAFALLRLAFARQSVRAPLTFRGRLSAGRFFIPGYDQVYLAPVVIVVAGCLAVLAVIPLPIFLTTKFAAIGFVLVLLTFGLPPGRDRWLLTGEHHLNITRRPPNERRTPSRRGQG